MSAHNDYMLGVVANMQADMVKMEAHVQRMSKLFMDKLAQCDDLIKENEKLKAENAKLKLLVPPTVEPQKSSG